MIQQEFLVFRYKIRKETLTELEKAGREDLIGFEKKSSICSSENRHSPLNFSPLRNSIWIKFRKLRVVNPEIVESSLIE